MGPLKRGAGAIGTGAWLIGRAGRGVWRSAWAGDPLAQRNLATALAIFLWRPLMTLLPLAALAGIIAGIAAARLLDLYRAELLVMDGLVRALLRDVFPLVVGTFASGSVSVALSARLGAMSLNREVDALETMGLDPVTLILSPSLAAILVAAPAHMFGAGAAALFTCGFLLHVSAQIGWHDYGLIALSSGAASALLTGMMKAIVFALIAFAVGATVGARPARTPADIGRRATRAFTSGLLGIFAAAALWTALA